MVVAKPGSHGGRVEPGCLFSGGVDRDGGADSWGRPVAGEWRRDSCDGLGWEREREVGRWADGQMGR